jgi:hypothetical protein
MGEGMSILNRVAWSPPGKDSQKIDDSKIVKAPVVPAEAEEQQQRAEKIVPTTIAPPPEDEGGEIPAPKRQTMGRPRATHLLRNNYVSVALTDEELKVLVAAKDTYAETNLGQLLRYAIFKGLGLARPHPEKINAEWGPTKKK